MKKHVILLLALVSNLIFLNAQNLKVGDPGVTIDQSKFDSDYPQMERWANAGVRGGIPFINSFNKTASVNPGNSAAINAAINALANKLNNGEKGLLTLKNGDYTINSSVNMKSNVSIKGESRDGVVCKITMNSGDAFSFNNVEYCGIYSLTITGTWGVPKYPWNYSLDANRETSNSNVSVKLKGDTENCWLDKVTILNSAKDPLRCPADHNTLRDLVVDGCHRKAGGAEGYFFIQGRDNLITGCKITHLRHISLQGGNVEYNVVYENDFLQEVSFHSGDAGNNLIANNRITLPSDMPPIEKKDGDVGPYPETENGNPIYFAIMGPWSVQHQNSEKPNYIYKNKCVQYNHNYGPQRPWSDDDKVYFGPKKIAKTTQDRIDNFPVYGKGAPSGGVLYAINLGQQTVVNVTGLSIMPINKIIEVGESFTIVPNVNPSNATNKTVEYTSSNNLVATVNNGVITGVSSGVAVITVKTVDGNKTKTCNVTVNPSTTTTFTLSPIDDAYIQTTTPYNNNQLKVENGKRVAYLKYDLSNVFGTIQSVQLKLTVNDDAGKGIITIYKGNNNNWTETTITSSNAPAQGVELGSLGNSNQNFVMGETYTWNLDVAEMNNLSKLSIIVKQTVGTNDVWFASSENTNIAAQPKLIVNTKVRGISTIVDKTPFANITVFPNPFTNVLQVNTNGSDVKQINLFDASGKVLYSKRVQSGESQMQLTMQHNLISGFYYLQIRGSNETKTIKVVKR